MNRSFTTVLGSAEDDAAQATEIERAYAGARGNGAALVAVARRLGAHPFDLANLINFESGWNPKAVNDKGAKPSYATGLIQFMPFTARNLGLPAIDKRPVDAILGMSVGQQLVFVEKYFRSVARGRDMSKPNVLYMAVFYPVAMDWSANREFSTAVQKANPGVLTPIDYVRRANLGSRLPTSPMAVPIAANASLAADLEEPVFIPPPVEEAAALGSRDVLGSGGWRYRQHRGGEVEILSDPRSGAPWIGKRLTRTDGRPWQSITSEIGPFPV